jgi:hypothetical protein
MVRDSAPFEKIKASGVDKLTSSYSDDSEKLTSKTPETLKDYLTDKEYMRPALKIPYLLVFS